MAIQSVKFFPELNLLRSFAILGVIGIHVSTISTSMALTDLAVFYMSIEAFSHFAVPCFIFISGFALYNKYDSNYSILEFYKKRILSVVPQYLLFSAFGLGFYHFAAPFSNNPIDLNPLEITKKLLTGTCYTHLWFFILIIQIYLSYPLIVAVYGLAQKHDRICALLGSSFLLLIISNIAPGENIITYIALPITAYLFYFFLGMHVMSNYEQLAGISVSIKIRIIIYLIFLAGTVIGTVGLIQKYFTNELLENQSINQVIVSGVWATMTSISFVVTIIVLLIVSRRLETEGSKMNLRMHTIGTLSFGIYLVHYFVLDVFRYLSKKIGFTGNNLLYFPTLFLATLSLSYLIVVLIKKLPYHQFIIGK